jgi:hypothetical protein
VEGKGPRRHHPCEPCGTPVACSNGGAVGRSEEGAAAAARFGRPRVSQERATQGTSRSGSSANTVANHGTVALTRSDSSDLDRTDERRSNSRYCSYSAKLRGSKSGTSAHAAANKALRVS